MKQSAREPGSTQITTPPSLLVRPGTATGRSCEKSSDARPYSNINPKDTIGRFSYGPTTQTTVVTTTTTTTTEFPPLMLRAPRHLDQLDPKVYPLAASPTPTSICKLVFEVNGRSATFEEAKDTLKTAEKFKLQTQALADSNGSLRSISNLPAHSTSHRPTDKGVAKPSASRVADPPQKAGHKRSASPVSIFEAAKIAAQEGPRKRRFTSEYHKDQHIAKEYQHPRRLRQPRLQTLQTSTPITPHVEETKFAQAQPQPGWRDISPHRQSADAQTSASSSATVGHVLLEDEPQILSPKSENGRNNLDQEVPERAHSFAESDLSSERQDPSLASARTPQVDEGEASFDRYDTSHLEFPARPRPQALNTTAAQDGSLPSPSLSPITAAAQIHARSQYGEHSRLYTDHDREDGAQLFQRQQLRRQSSGSARMSKLSLPSSHLRPDRTLASPEEVETPNQASEHSLMCIPQIVDDFESMPEDVKKYVIYQLLRRCSKTVLHFVSDVVSPTLKCDFLRHLPPELCEDILGHLDVKSLSAAAQVSSKWRQQVDFSEKVWKRLFDEDGYTLQEGEMARAIREGWGWQAVSGLDEAEQDLSLLLAGALDAAPPVSPLLPSPINAPQRPRRRGRTKAKASSKPARKRRQVPFLDTPETDDDALLVMTSASDGPYAAANAAAAAISLPRRDLHLWKSIYMRHHIIRKTWLQDEVAPRHIAFPAHSRHVVTCLQFDSDKILTGSDDANIHVYDTQTGVERAKLTGHEGGVWALQYEGNVLVSGSTDRSVRVWDIERGVCTHTFQGHTSTVRCLQILLPTPCGMALDGRPILMPKQPLIITGSRDSQLRVWKLPKSGDPHLHQAGPAQDESTESPYYVRTLSGHHHSVRAIAAHADMLVSGSYDCTVRVWKISTGETLHRLQGHTQKVYSVVLDSKRNRCISGSMDNVVKVWSLETGMPLFNLEGHSSLVGLLDLQQDRLVSAAADSTLRIWDPENGNCKSTLSAHTGAITCFQHDGQKVISGSDRTLKMWNVATGEFVKDLLTDLSGVWQVKFNERRCVAAVQRNNMTFIEVLDFGASRDGISKTKRGKRILVDMEGRERDETQQEPNLEVDLNGVN